MLYDSEAWTHVRLSQRQVDLLNLPPTRLTSDRRIELNRSLLASTLPERDPPGPHGFGHAGDG